MLATPFALWYQPAKKKSKSTNEALLNSPTNLMRRERDRQREFTWLIF